MLQDQVPSCVLTKWISWWLINNSLSGRGICKTVNTAWGNNNINLEKKRNFWTLNIGSISSTICVPEELTVLWSVTPRSVELILELVSDVFSCKLVMGRCMDFQFKCCVSNEEEPVGLSWLGLLEIPIILWNNEVSTSARSLKQAVAVSGILHHSQTCFWACQSAPLVHLCQAGCCDLGSCREGLWGDVPALPGQVQCACTSL